MDREDCGEEEEERGKVISGISRCVGIGRWEVVEIAEKRMIWSPLEMVDLVVVVVAMRMIERR